MRPPQKPANGILLHPKSLMFEGSFLMLLLLVQPGQRQQKANLPENSHERREAKNKLER